MEDQYYSKKPKSFLRLGKIKIQLKQDSFELYSGSGIFSKQKLDKGTRVLLEHLTMQDGWKVLDLGCGYGIVGVYVKRNFPETKVVMVDINKRAVKLARKNALAFGFEDMEAVESDLFSSVEGGFDTILANPPQRAGKDICFQLIEKSKEHLVEGGLLQLVARKNKGGNSLMEKMKEVFGNLSVLAKKGGYWVFSSKKE